MESAQLREILILTAKRSILNKYKYHRLDKGRLGEAEVRNVMAKTLEEKRITYALEYPTTDKFRRPNGNVSRVALVDMVIFENKTAKDPSFLIEFKRGQPQLSFMDKDFIKMMQAPSDIKGCCFFHILPKGLSASKGYRARAHAEIIKKYFQAYEKTNNSVCFPKRFFLFILDATSNQYYYCEKENICQIEGFDKGPWHILKARGRC
jgi:hypothetical protein